MDHNWPYVAAGYALTVGAIGSYVAWVFIKLRRAERWNDEP